MVNTRVPAAITLGSRTLPSTNRNLIILDAFDKLQLGEVLELTEESDPRGLRNEFLQHRAARFSWYARNLGSGRWIIRIERIDAQADAATFLSHCAPFANAKASTVRELAAAAGEHSYRHGKTIFDEGEFWPHLAFVRTGRVVLTLLSPEGKTHALGERLPLDALNETGTFDGGGATTRAEALIDCQLDPAAERCRHARLPRRCGAGGRLPHGGVARGSPFDRRGRGLGLRARAAAGREVLALLRSRYDRHGPRPFRGREPLANANRGGGRYRTGHSLACAPKTEEFRNG
jgi:uncharacterized protein (DUF2249 family)